MGTSKVLGAETVKVDQIVEKDAKDIKCVDPRQREVIVAYLSYALADVRKLSSLGAHLLQMTIVAISEDSVADKVNRPPHSHLSH